MGSSIARARMERAIILIDFFFAVLEPLLDWRGPAIDVGGSGRALWGSTDSSLDTSSLSASLADSSLDDACVFGELFTFLMAGAFGWLRSSVSAVSVPAITSIFSSNAVEPLTTRRDERCGGLLGPSIAPEGCMRAGWLDSD